MPAGFIERHSGRRTSVVPIWQSPAAISVVRCTLLTPSTNVPTYRRDNRESGLTTDVIGLLMDGANVCKKFVIKSLKYFLIVAWPLTKLIQNFSWISNIYIVIRILIFIDQEKHQHYRPHPIIILLLMQRFYLTNISSTKLKTFAV